MNGRGSIHEAAIDINHRVKYFRAGPGKRARFFDHLRSDFLDHREKTACAPLPAAGWPSTRKLGLCH